MRRLDVLEEHPGRALAALAAGSFVLRFAFAVNVRGPVYFRDEYLYSALARAIAHGSLLLRGQHVPGSTTSYLVPLITAPIWRLHDVDTAYRLAQALGSLAFSTTGFAAYAVARSVGVSKSGGVFVAGMSLLVPSGMFSGTLMTEPYAYPAFVASLLVAVPAIVVPSVRRVLAVVGISVGLCLIAGLQFAFFLPAWLIAFIAASRSRRTALRRVALAATLALATLVVLRASGSWVLVSSYEGSVRSLQYSVGTLAAWFGATALMVAVASGWVTLPGAILGFGRLGRMNERARVFALLALTLIVAFLAEAAVYGANSSFLYERFAFYCTPLLLIAFTVWFENTAWSARWPYVFVAYAAAAGVLLLPLTGSLDGSPSHSPTLAALRNLAPFHQGSGQIIWVPILAILAIAVAWAGPVPRQALLLGAAVVSGIATVGASRALIHRAAIQPTPHIAVANGAAFLTNSTASLSFFERTLFWNPEITRVLAIGGSPDGYGAETVTMTAAGPTQPDGTIAGGPYVVAPATGVWASSPVEARAAGIGVVSSSPEAVVFGYLRRSGYLTTYANVVLAGGDHGRVMTMRLSSRAGTKSVALSCGGRTSRTVVGRRPVTIRIPAHAGSTTNCDLRLVSGSPINVGGQTVGVRARISVAPAA